MNFFQNLNIKKAIVDDRKITEYLLNANHPDGRNKALFYIERGFTKESLKETLLNQLNLDKMINRIDVEFGTKYIFEAEVFSPDNRKFVLRSVWIVYFGEEFIKLVTAYTIK